MTNKWIKYDKKESLDLTKKYNITNVTQTVLNNRGIVTDDDLRLMLSDDINDLIDENKLPDILKGVNFIKEKIDQHKKIKIVGDYDVDGVCSTYILYKAFTELGADVDYILPDRVKDGYGINKSIIDVAINDKTDTIITCDNGVAANEEIRYAVENGISVVITDHHDIQELSKDAIAIIDPKRIDVASYPFKEICGAVVCYKFVKKLFLLFNKEFDYKEYLIFAGLATVCDIMPLINENHLIVKKALEFIKNTSNKGLRKILEANNLMNMDITTYHIGFIIGPQINASGRLSSAMICLKLFTSDDEKKIDEIVSNLHMLNEERKKDTDDGVAHAFRLYEEKYKNDKVLLIYLEQTNECVAGIVAGRVKEKYNKPTIVLTNTSEEGIIKASARSIDEYDMFANLSRYKDLFVKFGGHKLAAGFSLKKENLDVLRQNLNNDCGLTDNDFVKKYYVDFGIDIKYISKDLVADLEKLKPFGNRNEKAVFLCKNLSFKLLNVYGSKNNVLKIELKNSEKVINATLFEESDIFKQNTENVEKIDILYTLELKEFNGNLNCEMVIKDYRTSV